LMEALGYRYYIKAWDKIKQDFSIEVEFSHILTEGSENGYRIIHQEDFLTLNQVIMILNKTNRIGLKEKRRLLKFIKDSI